MNRAEIKVVMVTGAARRIGAVIATHLHQLGFNVVIHYRQRRREAQTLLKTLNEKRANSAMGLQGDFGNITNYKTWIQPVVAQWGRLDVLVNNASSFQPTPLDSATAVQWDHLFASNSKGPFFLTQAVLPLLANRLGCVINITDIHGYSPLKNHSIYSMAKASLVMFTKALAKECAPRVRINAVAPGAICWPEGENQLDVTKQEKITQKIPLGRLGTPMDIARTVAFLIEADYITGQTVAVDGGRSL